MKLAWLFVFFIACGGSQPQPLVRRFEHANDWVARFEDPARDAWQKPNEVVRAMQIAPGMKVADIGAGTGYFEPYLARAVEPTGIVYAVDIEPDMLRHIESRTIPSVKTVLANVGDPNLPERVDRILVVDTWHHIPQRAAYLAKLKTALLPNGTLTIVDFTLESPEGPPVHHRIAPAALLDELRAAGFQGERLELGLPNQYVIVAKI